jgi:hypothetical protein
VARPRSAAGSERARLRALRYPFTVYQSQFPLDNVGNTAWPALSARSDRVWPADRPTVDRWFDTGAFVQTSEPTATFGTPAATPARTSVHDDAALAKMTTIGQVDTELRVEAFNLPITPRLPSPVPSGRPRRDDPSLMPFTPMRQIQLVAKVRF